MACGVYRLVTLISLEGKEEIQAIAQGLKNAEGSGPGRNVSRGISLIETVGLGGVEKRSWPSNLLSTF